MSHAFAARTAYEHQPLRLCSQNATDGNTSHCKYRHSVFQKSQSAWTYYIDYDDDDNAGSQHSLYNIIMNYDVSHNNDDNVHHNHPHRHPCLVSLIQTDISAPYS